MTDMTETTMKTTQPSGPIAFFKKEDISKRFESVLGERSSAFVTSLISVIESNEKLAQCDPQSIMSAAMTSASLNLAVNPNLGFAYIIPYGKKATFQIGYKGFVQLAMRSGKFLDLDSKVVFEGQYKVTDSKFCGYEFARSEKTSDKIIGYVAYFKLLNGMKKMLYMSKEEMTAHAKKYSQSFAKGFGHRKDDFDAMGKKTVLKLLLSRRAPLDTDMQTAIESDEDTKQESQQEAEVVDGMAGKPEFTKKELDKIDEEKMKSYGTFEELESLIFENYEVTSAMLKAAEEKREKANK